MRDGSCRGPSIVRACAGGLVVGLAMLCASSDALAHRLDECLQAARIAVEPDRVAIELSVTPGVDVVEGIISDIDRSNDGLISPAEQRGFADIVRQSIELSNDNRVLTLTPGDVTFPDVAALRRGEGTIRLTFTAVLPLQTDGSHQVSFTNRYRQQMSVYLANALVPESRRIAVRAQHRDADQHRVTIDYTVGAAWSPSSWLLGGVVLALATILLRPHPRPHSQI